MKIRIVTATQAWQAVLIVFLLCTLPIAGQEDIVLSGDSIFTYNNYLFVVLDNKEKTAAYFGAGEWEGLCFKSFLGDRDNTVNNFEIMRDFYSNRLELATVNRDTYGIDDFYQNPPLNIMGEANGYTITEIYPYAFANSRLPKVPENESVYFNPENNFLSKKVQSAIVIPENIRTIGKKAFTALYNNSHPDLFDLGKDVTSIDDQALPLAKDGVMISRNVIPPTVNDNNFTESFVNEAWLYVPTEAIPAYKEHETWGKFQHIYAIEDIMHPKPQ